MELDPQDSSQLSAYTLLAKKIIFDTQRMEKFMSMLGTKEGALVAVQTVIAAIDKIKPIPAQLAPLLGVSVYLLMVDLAQDVTGAKADAKIMRDVVNAILAATVKAHAGQPQVATPAQAAPSAQPARPQGLIQQGA